MSRPRVVPISRRSRPVLTPDIWAPPPSDAEHAAVLKRVNARLAQRAAAKTSASDVATKRQEVPRVPRVARQPRQHALTLESKESSLKAIRHTVPARSDKSRAVLNVQPRNEPAGRCLAPCPMDFLIFAPMAPRATRFRAVDVSPLAFSLPSTPKVALKSILRGSANQQKRGEQKKVSFGDMETKEVEKWIGIVQGTESDNQLFYEGTRCKGRHVHVYPDPCRVLAGNLVGWARQGDEEDWDYSYLYGQSLPRGSHCDCPNSGCNRRNLYRRRRQ